MKDGNSVLKKVAEPVTVFDQKLKEISIRMIATMQRAGGIGLAANQVGILKRIVVMAVPAASNIKPIPKILINPVIVSDVSVTEPGEEGCLSFPGKIYTVERSRKVVVKYQDVNGNEKEEVFEGLAAVCIQHEIDHLNGITFDTKGI